MGCVGMHVSGSSFDTYLKYNGRVNYNGFPAAIPLDDSKNPDPRNYKILKHKQVGDCLIIKINYPNCTNYEGNKILVYHKCTIVKLEKQQVIDPHFSENTRYFSPVARFEPTETGWVLAEALAEIAG